MKVLDLQCAHGHVFEGWFASEEDFVSQSARSLVQCPACGNPDVSKKLSAPRLNLATRREDNSPVADLPSLSSVDTGGALLMANNVPDGQKLMEAWLAVARQVIANTSDIGNRFAEEARKMHYQEVEPRGIRGTATLGETRALLEEGIEVLPLVLPEALKETLQ